MKKKYITLLMLSISLAGYSQVGIGTKKPSKASVLHMEADGNKGVLFPKVKLTDLNTFLNSSELAESSKSENIGLTVFNTFSSGEISMGYYYWSGNEWIKVEDTKSIDDAINSLTYNISEDVVSTGIKFQDKDILTFVGNVFIQDGNSETKGVLLPRSVEANDIEIFTLKLFDQNNNVINIGLTDINVSISKRLINFSLGFGGFYTTLPEGNYNVVVEFTAKK